eukprot:1147786-Prorocentrum_minimum.AAC.2
MPRYHHPRAQPRTLRNGYWHRRTRKKQSRAPKQMTLPDYWHRWSVSPRRAAGVPGEPCDHRVWWWLPFVYCRALDVAPQQQRLGDGKHPRVVADDVEEALLREQVARVDNLDVLKHRLGVRHVVGGDDVHDVAWREVHLELHRHLEHLEQIRPQHLHRVGNLLKGQSGGGNVRQPSRLGGTPLITTRPAPPKRVYYLADFLRRTVSMCTPPPGGYP